MATSKITYTGNLRTQAVHLQSGNTIITDAPTDNNGKGEAFSPTDLLSNLTGLLHAHHHGNCGRQAFYCN
jgi:putative redox protein